MSMCLRCSGVMLAVFGLIVSDSRASTGEKKPELKPEETMTLRRRRTTGKR